MTPSRLWLSAAAAALLSACASTGDLPEGDGDVLKPILVADELETKVVWAVEAVSPVQAKLVKLVPLVHENRVYAMGADGRVSAFHRDNGDLVWTAQHRVHFTGGPGYHQGRLFGGTRNAEVLALDADDGSLVWRKTVSSEVLSPPRVSRDRVVVQTNDGKIFGLRPQDGEIVWVYDRTVPVLSLRGTSVPTLVGDQVIAGFANGRLAALSLLDGSVRWDQTIAVPRGRSELERMVDVDMEPQVVGDAVYTASYQGRVSALTLESGQVLWTRDMSAYLGLAASANHLFIVDSDGALWCLDRDSGATVWRQDRLAGRVTTAPVIMGKHIVVGAAEGSVYWLDREDGHLAADVPLADTSLRLSPTAVLAPSPSDYPGEFDLDRLHMDVDAVLGLQVMGDRVYVNYHNGLVATIRVTP